MIFLTFEFETNQKMSIQPTSTIRGINSNPCYILDSTEIIGTDAYMVHDDTDTQLAYMNGCAAQVNGPQKQIVKTEWFPSGVFTDQMTITVNYTTTNNDGSDLQENSRIFIGKIFKRHPRTHILLSTTDINFLHNTQLCNTVGIQPKNVQNNLLSNAILYFDSQYEYRLEIYTESQISTTQSIILDYIQLNYMNNLHHIHNDNITSSDSVSIIEANNNLSINIGTDGYGETTLTTQNLDQNTTTNILYNLFTNIQSVNVTLKDPDDWYAQKKMPIYSITTRWENNTNFYGGQKIIIRVVTNKTNNPHTVTGSYIITGSTKHINI